MANTLHAGSHAFIHGIDLLPVPAGSSHPYLIPVRTHARIESPLCMLDPAHAWTRSTHARSPCVHALGPHACTHARRMTMRARTGSPRTNAGPPCIHAPGLHAHACTALILCPCTLDPHAHARPPCAYAHAGSPHARMHRVSPHMQAHWIPMRARTRSSHTHAHPDLACTVYFGIALVVQ